MSYEVIGKGSHRATQALFFADRSCLVFDPILTATRTLDDLSAVVLYTDNNLEAQAIHYLPHHHRSEERSFWSKGAVSQQQLAGYWNAAVDEANKLCERYHAKEISDEQWRSEHRVFEAIVRFAPTMRRELEAGTYPVSAGDPRRFLETLAGTSLSIERFNPSIITR
jgi:hypothetical protein